MEAENKQPAEVDEPAKNQEPEASSEDATTKTEDTAAKTEDAAPDTTDNATEKTNGTEGETNGSDETENNEAEQDKEDEAGEKRSSKDEVEIPAKKSKVDNNGDGAGDAEEQGEEGKQPPPLVKEKTADVNEGEKTTLTAEA